MASSGVRLVVVVACTGSRPRLRGARGGRASDAARCARLRGSTQPTSETNSSRYVAANQGEEYTENSDSRSYQVASVGFSAANCAARAASTLRCGTSEPGTAASASRNSRTSAVRMDVSCRQAHRASSSGCSAGGRGSGGTSRAGALVSVWSTTATPPG